MRWLDHFRNSKKNTAATAKERLQIIIAHERNTRARPEFLDRLQAELLEVVKKYVAVAPDAVRLNLEKSGEFEVLELNITLPDLIEGRTSQRPSMSAPS